MAAMVSLSIPAAPRFSFTRASMLPTARHCDGPGRTTHGNAASVLPWLLPIACVANASPYQSEESTEWSRPRSDDYLLRLLGPPRSPSLRTSFAARPSQVLRPHLTSAARLSISPPAYSRHLPRRGLLRRISHVA